MKTTLSPSNPLCWRKVLPAVLVALLTLAATPLRAQYFDWVRTYQSTFGSGTGSPDEDNMVLEMDADSKGNIYFIGRCVRGAEINGEELLYEVNHYNPSHNHYSLCIVKMSPQGEMMWHKAISHWEGHISRGYIQVVGDSAVACLVGYPRPWDVYHPAYWLDSLVQFPNWFVPTDSISSNGGTALVILDLDGHLKEQHFLNVGYLDTLGVPIVSGSTPSSIVAPLGLGAESFCIDHEGNIILGMGCGTEKGYRTIPCDTCNVPWQSEMYSVENGGVGAVRIMIDGTRSLFYYPENRPILTNAKLLKFSPHFDTLLEVRYLMQSRLDSPRTWGIDRGISDSKIMHIASDSEGNLYAVGCITVYNTLDTIVPIDSLQGLSLHLSGNKTGFIIKYTPQLRPVFVKQWDLDEHYSSFFAHAVVEDDNLFVYGGGSCGADRTSIIHYDGEPLSNFNRGNVFLRLSKEDGSLRSYGVPRSCPNNGETGHIVDMNTYNPTLAVHNNRVAARARVCGSIAFAGDTVYALYDQVTMIWDYDGHELTLLDHQAPDPHDRSEGALFSDSSLYLYGMFNGEITFGDTSFYRLHSNGYVARYVDTSFLRPYVHPEHPDTGDVRIVLAESGVAFVAYPNPFRQRVTIIYSGSDPIASAFITDMLGRREPVSLLPLPADAGGSTRFVADLTTAPQATYLLTLVTASGHQHTLRLLKQSDIFGN